MPHTYSTTFHRSFALHRPAINSVLEFIAKQKDQKFTQQNIYENSTLGTIYAESMPRYAVGAGLLTPEKDLSRFGAYALQYDPLLQRHDTQWLIHYHLSAPHGPGPLFWHRLVRDNFIVGHTLQRSAVFEQIQAIHQESEGKPLAKKSTNSTTQIFLKTYTNSDGLGALEMLTTQDQEEFHVQEPAAPSVWAFGYMLLDYWQANYPTYQTVNLLDLSEAGSLRSLLLLSSGQFGWLLNDLQQAGILEVYRISPPYQVALLHRDPYSLLEKIYV
ncbi:MAG: hypothetical protein OHK0052_13270 [Anaerolineales bacterium]